MNCRFCKLEFDHKDLIGGSCYFCLDECSQSELEDVYITASKEERIELGSVVDRRFPPTHVDLNDFFDTSKERE